jgi:2-polyprenyl-6-methoxyphenol hydroxylase-like FAD-dependent oxidoreductase
MKHRSETEVLVVGAGPVGMFAALQLIRAGIDVQIIDHADRTTSRSNACGLHPHSLALFSRAGLVEPVLQAGHRVDSVAFYDRVEEKAQVDFLRLPGEFPYALALSQSSLEKLLEAQLQEKGKSRIRWMHRLSKLDDSGDRVVATVEKLGVNAQGYVIPHMEQVVEHELEVSAAFVIGADGPDSETRTCLKIGCGTFGQSDAFTLCDFESATDLGNQARIVLDQDVLDAMWPISAHTGRWFSRTAPRNAPDDFPHKEHTHFVMPEPESRRAEFEQSVQARIPGAKLQMDEIDWLVDVPFTPRLANEFGRSRCWLAGDAAHQASPIGFHSLNVGLSEAVELTGKLKRILRDGESTGLLQSYGRNRRREWELLFNFSRALRRSDDAEVWVRNNAPRLLSLLPASGEDLVLLSQQLGLEFDKDAGKSVAQLETA